MNKMKIAGAAGFFVVLILVVYYFGFGSGSKKDEGARRVDLAMGTFIEIEVRDDVPEVEELIDKAVLEIKRIDSVFTTYNDSSLIMKFNYEPAGSIKVTSEIYNLINRCIIFTAQTDGAFDVAIHRIIKLWDFSDDTVGVPPAEELKKARELSGSEHLNPLEKYIIEKKRSVQLNFGASAKGYAVDRAFDVLHDNGLEDFLVNVGGEVRTSGANWVIGIQHPRKESELLYAIEAGNKSVATSGDYEKFKIIDGEKYSHIIDPATGYPSKNIISVTVIADDCFTADGFATGIFVLGHDKGIEIVEKHSDIEVLIIDSSGEEYMSSGFSNYIRR